MKFKKTQGFQTMGKRTLFTSMAAVALLGATTTAVTATMNVNQVNAAATTKSDTIVVDYNLPIIKDGVETTVKVSIVVENVNEWRLFTIVAPKIDGYTPNMQDVLLSRSPEGKIIFEEDALIYTKTGNPTNPGDGSSSESNNSNSSSNNESSDSNNSSNHESNSESSNQESNGTSSSSNDESSNNGSSNGASNNESSNSSSSVNNGSNNGTSNNTDSNGAGETSHSAAGTVNTTNNGQNGSANSADKATNTADKTGNKPTTLLQTGQDNHGMTITTIFAGIVASLSGLFVFGKRF